MLYFLKKCLVQHYWSYFLLFFLLIFLEPLAFAILIGTGDKGYFSASPKLIALPVFIL